MQRPPFAIPNFSLSCRVGLAIPFVIWNDPCGNWIKFLGPFRVLDNSVWSFGPVLMKTLSHDLIVEVFFVVLWPSSSFNKCFTLSNKPHKQLTSAKIPGLIWPDSVYTHESTTLGDYSCSFEGSVELIYIAAAVSVLLLQDAVTEKNSPQECARSWCNYSYII